MKVTWRVGTTINIGDFSNVKYEVEISDDSREGESKEAASTRVAKFAEDQLDEKITETKEDLSNAIKETTDMAKRLSGK